MRIHGATATTFTLLLAGFVLLDLGHFGFPILNTVAAYMLIACALAAWYMMARILLNEVHGREVLPAGQPWVGARTVASAGLVRGAMAPASAAGVAHATGHATGTVLAVDVHG